MALGVVAVRRQRRRLVTAPGETPSGVLTHLAVAITRYARQLRNDGLPVPPTLDELAAFLTMYVRTRHAATGVDGEYGAPEDVPVMPRLPLAIHSDLVGARAGTEKGAPDLGECGC